MSLTRAKVKALREQLDAVLQANGVQGFEFELRNARYGGEEVTFQLHAKVAGAQTKEQKALDMYAVVDGVDPDKVSSRGERLVEYHPRKRKYPYIMENKAGTRYKITTEEAQRRFPA
jgi:hypothetical protein